MCANLGSSRKRGFLRVLNFGRARTSDLIINGVPLQALNLGHVRTSDLVIEEVPLHAFKHGHARTLDLAIKGDLSML